MVDNEYGGRVNPFSSTTMSFANIGRDRFLASSLVDKQDNDRQESIRRLNMTLKKDNNETKMLSAYDEYVGILKEKYGESYLSDMSDDEYIKVIDAYMTTHKTSLEETLIFFAPHRHNDTMDTDTISRRLNRNK